MEGVIGGLEDPPIGDVALLEGGVGPEHFLLEDRGPPVLRKGFAGLDMAQHNPTPAHGCLGGAPR